MTHPKRLRAAEELAAGAPEGALRVVMDPDPAGRPSVLRTALAAWSAVEEGATHHLVVQDDMRLSGTFFERVLEAIGEMPDAALALFALWDSRNGAAVRLGALSGARWVGAVNEYFPCVAIVLPRHVAAGFVEYGRRRLDGWPDDILMYRYLSDRGVPAYVSVPSLAEHEDHGSISGNGFRGPRRSVCFLSSDPPGREDARLTGLRVVPFFKHGVAQCAVRHPGPGPRRWLHLDCERYLDGEGVRAGSGRPAIVRLAEAAEPGAARGTWLTAFTMGLVHEREARLRGSPYADGAAPPDPAVLAECLATVGPGGISHTCTEERIAQRRAELARIAHAGVEAGREAAVRRRAGRRPRSRRVGVLHGATPLGEHLVRGLTDRGHRVTALGGPVPRVPAGLDAVVDLGGLVGRTTGGGPAVRIRDGADGVPRTAGGARTLYVGDVYGPGCPRDSRIGRMVWEALRGRPLVLGDRPAGPVRPLHVNDLADAVSQVLRTPPRERALFLGSAPRTPAELAEAVRKAVRPVPVEAGRAPAASPGPVVPEPAAPPLPGWRPATGLLFGLHTFAQWLAYEGVRLAPDDGDEGGMSGSSGG
ncbi:MULTISPECIES: NAD(P)-dependent oxidoreductase [Streptomyces]|nr:NAD(P)-dependent oxidoreductase [Streptomyces ruber]